MILIFTTRNPGLTRAASLPISGGFRAHGVLVEIVPIVVGGGKYTAKPLFYMASPENSSQINKCKNIIFQ